MIRPKWLNPGDLVRAKLNQHVSVWLKYETRFNEYDDFKVRVKLHHPSKNVMNKAALALIVGIYNNFDIPEDNNIVMLFLPQEQVFCYTWSTWLMKIQ